MINKKQRILLIATQEDWPAILGQTFPDTEFEFQTAATLNEADLLDGRSANIAIVNPGFGTGQDREPGMRFLDSLSQQSPDLPLLLVIKNPEQGIVLKGAWLEQVRLIVDPQWTPGELAWLLQRALASELTNTSNPTPPEVSTAAIELTGRLAARGITRPLPAGLNPPPVGSRVGKPRVLVVEDNAEWQHKFAQPMETEGYFWRIATTYDEAVERLRFDSFHVVLIDLLLDTLDMPVHKGNGWQLLDFIVAELPKTKVIAASGEATRSDVARLFMRYPIKGFIDKEAFNEQELINTVREQLAGPMLKVQMLGNFMLWRNGTAINHFDDDYAEKIIKILLTRRGEKVSVEELIDCLWPGGDPKASAARLASSVGKARLALEPDLPRANDSNFILRDGASYVFNMLANLDVDAEQLRRLVSEGGQAEREGRFDDAIGIYERARATYQGDFLPRDRVERWAISERAALQTLYTEALNHLGDLYANRGDIDLAIEAANRSLQVDSYIESTYRRLMRYHTCNGDRGAALGVYRALVKLFSEFFGEGPSIATAQLSQEIEAGRSVACVETRTISGEWRTPSSRGMG